MDASGRRKKKTVCVTGGNGYIASALVKMLLEKGYAVKTTVRNPDDMSKNSHLKDLQALGSLEVLRADMAEEGSFDQAVAGCDYAFLVAAPVNYAVDPEEELLDPAVRGTVSILRSCVKAGTVRRVVLTSSIMAVTGRPMPPGYGHVLDEESWSDVEYLRAHKPLTWAYGVSKVLLEKEASRFAQEHGISLVTVCPVLVVGPAPAQNVRTSVSVCLSLLSGDEAAFAPLKAIEEEAGAVGLVHMDDVCRAEVFLAETEAASGRYICCSLNTTIAELARFLAAKHPEYSVKKSMLTGVLDEPRAFVSSAKLVREGFEFERKNLDEICDGLVEFGRGQGILPSCD